MASQVTAKDLSLISCHICNRLYKEDSFEDPHNAECKLCGSKLHMRKPDSVSKTWALVITAFIAYIPANIYPIMTVEKLGTGDPHTIIGGVEALLNGGQWPLAVLVFFASIFVPLVKILGLIVLLVSVQKKWKWKPNQRNVLYRIVEAVGKWSMIDIFMISILVALVQLGSVASIVAGEAATFFALVVIITMFAAMAFDPRLVWDNAKKEEVKENNEEGGSSNE